MTYLVICAVVTLSTVVLVIIVGIRVAPCELERWSVCINSGTQSPSP